MRFRTSNRNNSSRSMAWEDVKLSRKAADLSCNTTGELRLRQALTRRSLAFDQCKLCSFDVMEMWHNFMMHALMKEPPAGHKYVTAQQVIAADKELWGLLSQRTRGKLRVDPGGDPPMNSDFTELSTSPLVLCVMTPLPASKGADTGSGSRSEPAKPQPPKISKAPERQQPQTNKRKASGSGATVKELLKTCRVTAHLKQRMANSFVCTTTMEHANDRRVRRATWGSTFAIIKDVAKRGPTLSAATEIVSSSCQGRMRH